MVKDDMADLRIFHGVFQRKTNVSHESFAFIGNTTIVIVSVDYSQSGTQNYLTFDDYFLPPTGYLNLIDFIANGVKRCQFALSNADT